MKSSSQFVLLCSLILLLASAACNYTKPVMYIDIANRSGHSLENVEVKHPTGAFGVPTLRNEQTHQHMAPIGSPCKFSLAFDDQAGKHYLGNYDLGTSCPTEIVFEVGPGMAVSQRTARP
jgi:hypothetical protein